MKREIKEHVLPMMNSTKTIGNPLTYVNSIYQEKLGQGNKDDSPLLKSRSLQERQHGVG